MKRNAKSALSIFAASAVLALTLAGCGGGNDATDTSAPADNSGSEASTTAVVSGTVSTNGSTSMEKVIGSLKEQFQKDNDGQVTVSYDATGSGAGIEAVTNGTTDIGLSSRALKDEETSAGLTGTTVALDGIAYVDEQHILALCFQRLFCERDGLVAEVLINGAVDVVGE